MEGNVPAGTLLYLVLRKPQNWLVLLVEVLLTGLKKW